MYKKRKITDEMCDEMRDEMRDELRDELREEIRKEITKELTKKLHTEITEEITEEITDILREEISESVTDEIKNDIRKETIDEIREEITTHVENKFKLITDYKCIICFDIFVNTYTLPCGHSFCGFCTFKLLDTSSKCAYCNMIFNLNSIIKNYSIDSISEKIHGSIYVKRLQEYTESAFYNRHNDNLIDRTLDKKLMIKLLHTKKFMESLNIDTSFTWEMHEDDCNITFVFSPNLLNNWNIMDYPNLTNFDNILPTYPPIPIIRINRRLLLENSNEDEDIGPDYELEY
jgi:hypothetical protein